MEHACYRAGVPEVGAVREATCQDGRTRTVPAGSPGQVGPRSSGVLERKLHRLRIERITDFLFRPLLPGLGKSYRAFVFLGLLLR